MREGKSQTIFQNEKQDDKNTLLIIRQYNFFSSHQFLFILNYKKIKSVEGATVLQCNLMLTRPKWTISAATRQHFSMHKFHNDMIIQFDFADYLTHMHACTHTHKKIKIKKQNYILHKIILMTTIQYSVVYSQPSFTIGVTTHTPECCIGKVNF